MKKFAIFLLLAVIIVSCRDNEINLFDKPADERVAEARTNLINELIAPANGWLVKYRPDPDMGIYNVLLKFDANGWVNIKTDLSVNDGEFYDHSVTYRIDNSMGLELIFETYSFFSYLFEQDMAEFGAEFEYVFVNKTPDNALVFVSKSDRGTPTRFTLIPAKAGDENLLGRTVSENLRQFTSSSMKMNFVNKDLAFNFSRDNLRRSITFTYVSKKTDITSGEELDFSTGYLIQADSLVFDKPLTGSFNNYDYTIRSIKLNQLSETSINICPEPTQVPVYSGFLNNTSENVVLETSLFDIYGANFHKTNTIFFGPIYIFDQDGRYMGTQFQNEVKGAEAMVLLYKANTRFEQQPLTAIGFYIDNGTSDPTFAMKKFVPTLTENNLRFNFENNFTLYDNQNTQADLSKINPYLDKLTEGGRTYVFRFNRYFYEFYNPCTGWRFYFQVL
jgi:hypothetical protein